jgi:Na+/H+ antiporter NhaD/arsenite permease-like protein
MFFVVDMLNFRRAPRKIQELETAHEEWRFLGLTNLFYLAVVLGSVFIHHPLFLRELIMTAAACGSYFTTKKHVHDSNDFNFGPIKEVATLFAAIFATMMPALDWLQANAAQLGQPSPGLFFWGSGALSSVLDNAPTYLSFLSAEFGAFVSPDTTAAIVTFVKAHGSNLAALAGGPHAAQIGQAIGTLQLRHPAELAAGTITPDQAQMALILGHPVYIKCLQAISMGSVFFGANTYIGNGPNFMVKAIADQQKAHTPTFLGYIFKFTVPYMLPMLVIIWWLFFRG